MNDINDIKELLRITGKYYGCEDLYWNDELQFYVICNDVFMWGCSDSEEVKSEDLGMLEQALIDSEDNGMELFCARKREMRPQGALYAYLPRKEWHHFDACGEERETGLGNPPKPK